jgi:ABC-type transporter Mla subunit MlaD
VDVQSVLDTVLVLLAISVCGVGLWALTELIKMSRSARVLFDDLDQHLVPLIEKADITIDAINAELLRIDDIVTRVEDASEKVSATSNVVQGAVNAPMEAVNLVGGRLRRWMRVTKTARR